MAADQNQTSNNNRPDNRPNDRQGTEQNSYNKMGMFTFIASMVVSLGVLIYVSFLSAGIDLKEVPDQKAEQKTEQKVPGNNAPTDPQAPAAAPAEEPAVKKDGA